ncbi:MAG: response regulator [Candidatus Moranbacteria bacterium]|nr:response regulator [Candidatus Moranbacteria bacterium]
MDKKILVVEDESSLQNAMKEFLLAEHFTVAVASDGEEAMRKVKSEKPDLILLDIVLPKKDGFEVLAEIKADEMWAKIPVILLTNLESADDVDKAFSLGVNTYLVKSNYKLEEIVGKIKEMLKI